MSVRIETQDGKLIVEYGVTKIPTRKQKCLYRMMGNDLLPLAYFKSDADAKEFEDFLYILAPGEAKPRAGNPK